MKNFVLAAFILCAVFFLCQSFEALGMDSENRLEIVSTLFPTYDFVRQIGGENVNVTLLLPPGVEAHTFEPRPADVVRVSNADIFIYTGLYMEPWVGGLLKGISNKELLVVDTSRGIEFIGEEDVDSETGAYGHENHTGVDPHIWLDLGNAQVMTDTIAEALSAKDPENKQFYFKKAAEYKLKLTDLDGRFKQAVATAKYRTIIYGGHFAFGYFAKRYGLEYDSPYNGFSPNAEPGPRAIADLIKKLKISGMRYVYYEELIDPKVARIISEESGAKLELLHAGHNISKKELDSGVTFLDIMEDNLRKLEIGLECK